MHGAYYDHVLDTVFKPPRVLAQYDLHHSGNIDEEELFHLCYDLGVSGVSAGELMAQIDRKRVGEVNLAVVHCDNAHA